MEVRFPGRLRTSTTAEDHDVVIKDFSPEGVKVLSTKRLSVAERLTVSFLSEQAVPFKTEGSVIWVDQISLGAWHAGIKFDTVDLLQARRIRELSLQPALP